MEEMIKRIVDMDKKAREITEAAEHEKLESEKTIAAKVDQIREEYLTRARRRIRINKEQENVVMEQEWAKTKVRYDQQIEHMNELYEHHGEEWVKAIVERVLSDGT